jgi:hypothetical protein
MDKLVINATSETPFISFSPLGKMVVSGKSISVDAVDFWKPIHQWFEVYMRNPAENTIFQLRLAYLNISSSKEVLHLLYRLNDLAAQGRNAHVEWLFNADDEDMQEVGRDYEHMVRVPFIFKKLETELIQPCE